MALTRITQGVIKPNENYDTHNINSTGIITATGANISGNMSVGGVLTYEDVTNIDSIGIITARSDIKVGTAVTITSAGAGFYAGIVTASSFKLSDGSNVGGIDSDGSQNTVGGSNAGDSIVSGGTENTVFGYNAGTAISNGDSNTFIGSRAGRSVTTGLTNTGVGYNVMGNASGTDNAALGSDAGNGMGDGRWHVAIGKGAFANTNQLGSQQNNIVIGYLADVSSSTVSNEMTLGNANINHVRIPGIGVSFSEGGGVVTGIMTASSFKLLDGSAVGGVTSDSDGNTVGGTDAGSNLTTGTLYNTLFGYQAGQSIVPGSSTSNGDSNTFIGYEAGESATTAYENVAIGYQAGNSFTTLPRSTLVGAQAGKGSTNGNDGVGYKCVGGSAGGASGYGNSGYGKYALSRLTSGLHNTCVGAYAGNYLSDGDRNTIMGENAGHMVNGNDNVIIGQDAAYDDNNSPFNTGSNCIIIGSHAMPTGQAVSNEITLGNTSIDKFRIPGLNITIDSNGISDAKGNLRSIPQQNEQGSTHTLVAADAGKHILADNTVTVPPTSGIFSAGDAITIVNAGSSNISIAKGSGVTLYNSADGSDTGRTLSAKGMATILCAGVNTYYISGAGLS